MLEEKDTQILKEKGITLTSANEQLNYFRTGFPVLDIVKPAIIGEGILALSADRISQLQQIFDKERTTRKIVKFVPASGAATRMFKALFEFLESKELNKDTEEVIAKINSFAFYSELKQILENNGISVEDASKPDVREAIIDKILNPGGLNYGNLPKGLLKFHLYDTTARTAFEEHLVEGVLYATGKDNLVQLHFTVSTEHRKGFTNLLYEVQKKYESQYGVKFNVSFSEQKPSTDTLAADANNEPFRDKNGNILFRPGGHGALLDNLNDTDADIIFIKNIDNVVPDKLKAPTIQYKKALAGLLLETQTEIFKLLKSLESNNQAVISEANTFVNKNLGYNLPQEYFSFSPAEKVKKLRDILNRPLRVCGMVRNQGEPGGGPFWVKDEDNSLSLQILESSQFDMTNPQHKLAFQGATHFNPVDLICSTKDKDGKSFDLHKFRDPKTGFISRKSKDGKELKALELPGLWNGSMAFWNTIFVEVPIETFNPVKTINDLLRPQHIG